MDRRALRKALGTRRARRDGTKALICGPCNRKRKGTGKNIMSFRGKGRARLDRHLREVH